MSETNFKLFTKIISLSNHQAEKRYNVQLALQTLRTIIALGYQVMPKYFCFCTSKSLQLFNPFHVGDLHCGYQSSLNFLSQISMDKPPARIRAVRLPNDPFLQVPNCLFCCLFVVLFVNVLLLPFMFLQAAKFAF